MYKRQALKAERDYDEVIFTTPDGEQFNQPMANSLSLAQNLIILCDPGNRPLILCDPLLRQFQLAAFFLGQLHKSIFVAGQFGLTAAT